MIDNYNIKNVHGHYEVYEKQNGNFVVSGDTYREAEDELIIVLSEQ